MHGMTEEVAYNALCSFIDKAFLEGLRCLLVIVGKGKRGAGVIKSNFRDWIESDIEFSRRVMMIKESLPHIQKEGLKKITSYETENIIQNDSDFKSVAEDFARQTKI